MEESCPQTCEWKLNLKQKQKISNSEIEDKTCLNFFIIYYFIFMPYLPICGVLPVPIDLINIKWNWNIKEKLNLFHVVALF